MKTYSRAKLFHRRFPKAQKRSRTRPGATGLELEQFLEESEDLVWAFVGHRDRFPSSLAAGSRLGLRLRIEQKTSDWHPTIRRIVSETDPASVEAFDFRAAAPLKP